MSHKREPIEYTCPDIDKAIAAILSVFKSCRLSDRASEEELRSIISDIEYELYGVDVIMEDLRKSNWKLRAWGTEEAEEVDRLEDNLEAANVIITELRQIKSLTV